MKILMIASASFAPFFLANSPGDELDLPEELATDLIAAGCAQLVEETAKEIEVPAEETGKEENSKEPEEEKVTTPAVETPTESTSKKAKVKQ